MFIVQGYAHALCGQLSTIARHAGAITIISTIIQIVAHVTIHNEHIYEYKIYIE